MTGTPDASARRPGPISLGAGALLLTVAAVKVALWYCAISSGAASTSAMTGWEWFWVGFYHVAVVASIAGLIGMLRARSRVKDA